MLDMADDQAFLLPVVIDGTPEAAARVPDRFRERQWVRLPGGNVPADFTARVARLLANGAPRAFPQPGSPAAPPANRSWRTAGATLVTILVVAGIFAAWRTWHGTTQPAAVAPAPSPAATPPDRKSVAVLPFANLSGRAEDAYLADGLHEEILSALSRLRDLKVISRTSVMEYRNKAHNLRDIAQRLGVGTVLEGSVRREGGALRLTVQLIDAHSDRHLLAVNYDRDLGHLLDLQSNVARRVADSLAATLSRYERDKLDRVATNNGDAYDRYLRAVALFRRPVPGDDDGLVEPKRLLAEALRFDPDYADALALLSQAHTWSHFLTGHAEEGPSARKAYERALAIDPQLPEAQLARGLYSMYVARDVGQALADLDAVVKTRPGSAAAHSTLGYALRRRARMDEALEHFVRAWDLDPLNDTYAGAPIVTLLGLRRFPEAIEQTRLYSRRFPNVADPHFVRARIESYLGHTVDPLRAALRDHGALLDAKGRSAIEAEIAEAEGRYLDAIGLWEGAASDPLFRLMRTGFLYFFAGDVAQARKRLAEGERTALARLKARPALADNTEFMPWVAVAQSVLDRHDAAVATMDALRARTPESRDATNGPSVSLVRSVVLLRAGRKEEAHAEVARLMRVPFGAIRPGHFLLVSDVEFLLVKDDALFDELLNRPPRL